MGYRSDVAYIVSFSSHSEPEVAFAQYLRFKEWVKSHTIRVEVNEGAMTEDYNYEAACRYSELKFYDSECMMIFSAEDVKWYETHAEVEWHQQIMYRLSDNADDQYSKGAWRFARIGEEYTDIEIDEGGANNNSTDQVHDLWRYIDVGRTLSLNPPREPLPTTSGADIEISVSRP